MLSQTFGILVLLLATTTSASSWNYDDDTQWCSSAHWYCCPAKQYQSPININTLQIGNQGVHKNCPHTNGLDWELDTTTQYTMKNTGHSLQVKPISSGVGTFPGKLIINDKEFCLEQFHVHWGESNTVGSEHTINGVSASLEVHFVHYLCTEGSVADALTSAEQVSNGDDAYYLAVVSVLYIDDTSISHRESGLLKHIIDHSSEVEASSSEVGLDTSGNTLRMTDLVHSSISHDPVYFYYKGSLTTPGCNPYVHWNVLRDPMYVSNEDLTTLRASLKDEHGKTIEKNYRSTQRNNNKVYLCGDHEASHSGDDSDDSDVHHHHFESSD